MANCLFLHHKLLLQSYNILMMDKLITALFVIGILILSLFLYEGSSEESIYSVDQAVNQSNKLIGQKISVKGEVVSGRLACTQLYCGEGDKCCNTCTSNIFLSENRRLKLLGDEIGCSGSECKLNCTPETNKFYRVDGALKSNRGDLFLDVANFTRYKE